MIGAAMGLVLPWRVVPGAFIWLALIAAGMSMWKLAREWVDGPQALVAAVLYAVNPYQLILVYYRSDFAELLAEPLFPLLLWGAVRISRGEWRKVPWLAAIFAGIWISDAPAAVMATYSFALAIAVGCIVRRASGLCFPAPRPWRPLRPRGVLHFSRRLGTALGADRRGARGSLSPGAIFFSPMRRARFHEIQLAGLLGRLGAILVTIAAVAAAWRRRREVPDVWWIVATLGAAALFLMTPPSALAWRYLPRLQFTQSPWRWLGALGAAYALFVAATMGRLPKRTAWLVPALVLAAIIGAATALIRTAWWDPTDVPTVAEAIRSGRGYEGTDEYMPLGGDRYQLPGNPDDDTRPDDVSADPAPRIAMVDPASGAIVAAKGARIHVQQWNAEHKIITADSAAPVRIAPRLLAYPAWEIRVDGAATPYDEVPATTQMIIALPAGEHRIEIHFRRTWDRTAGAAISSRQQRCCSDSHSGGVQSAPAPDRPRFRSGRFRDLCGAGSSPFAFELPGVPPSVCEAEPLHYAFRHPDR